MCYKIRLGVLASLTHGLFHLACTHIAEHKRESNASIYRFFLLVCVFFYCFICKHFKYTLGRVIANQIRHNFIYNQ